MKGFRDIFESIPLKPGAAWTCQWLAPKNGVMVGTNFKNSKIWVEGVYRLWWSLIRHCPTAKSRGTSTKDRWDWSWQKERSCAHFLCRALNIHETLSRANSLADVCDLYDSAAWLELHMLLIISCRSCRRLQNIMSIQRCGLDKSHVKPMNVYQVLRL